MATISNKRRRDIALRPEDRAGFQLLGWFGYYSRDHNFCAALESLALEHHQALSRVMDDRWYMEYTGSDIDDPGGESFIAAVEEFERNWLLDRLRDGIGTYVLWSWMQARGRPLLKYPEWLNAPPDTIWSPRYFGNSLPPGFMSTNEPDIELTNNGEAILRLDRGLWNPRTEHIGAARDRLEQETKQLIAAELDRIATAFEAAGWTMEDTKTEAHKYAGWAYRRWIQREPEECGDIAASEPAVKRPSERTVRERTNDFAREIGFDFPKTRRRDAL